MGSSGSIYFLSICNLKLGSGLSLRLHGRLSKKNHAAMTFISDRYVVTADFDFLITIYVKLETHS